MNNSLKSLPILLVLMLTLAFAAPAAFAQSSQDGYIQSGPSIVDRTGNDADISDTSPSAELPFTGLDLGFIGAAGLTLLLMGAGMRRMTRAHDSAA